MGVTRSATSTHPHVPEGVTWFILGWANRAVAMQSVGGKGRVVKKELLSMMSVSNIFLNVVG